MMKMSQSEAIYFNRSVIGFVDNHVRLYTPPTVASLIADWHINAGIKVFQPCSHSLFFWVMVKRNRDVFGNLDTANLANPFSAHVNTRAFLFVSKLQHLADIASLFQSVDECLACAVTRLEQLYVEVFEIGPVVYDHVS